MTLAQKFEVHLEQYFSDQESCMTAAAELAQIVKLELKEFDPSMYPELQEVIAIMFE